MSATPRGSLSVPGASNHSMDGDVESLEEWPSCSVAQWKNQQSIRPQMGVSRTLNPITRRKHRDYVIDHTIVKGQVQDYVVAKYDLEK